MGRLSLALSKEFAVWSSGMELALDVRGAAVLSDSAQLEDRAVGLEVGSAGGDVGACGWVAAGVS